MKDKINFDIIYKVFREELILIWVNKTSFWSSRQPHLWGLSMVVGIVVALAAIVFRELIGIVQWTWLGSTSENVSLAMREIKWWWILLTPTIGGLIVGIALEKLLSTHRINNIADVIESCTKGGRDIDAKTGIGSAVISAFSLGVGASAGREGPLVHLGATISELVVRWFHLPKWGDRTLVACGVAAAISASFNAPIAGLLFAHEIILGHYAKRSFVPIVIACTSATIVSRLWFGDAAAFIIPEYQITSYFEFPAFALLGVVCALISAMFQFSLIGTDQVARAIAIPLWLRPCIGGAMIGTIGIAFPEVLGVGYEATDMALRNQLPVMLLLTLLVAKTAATAITMASRFGGGVVSPSLYLGAMGGGAFGLIAASVFPEMASSQGLYSILGMGAVAAALLGAPISTVVMVFELTGGYTLSIALFLTVSIAVGLHQSLQGMSFFQWQLASRGFNTNQGPHGFMLHNTVVKHFMTELEETNFAENELEKYEEECRLSKHTDLGEALKIFDETGHSYLPVMDGKELIGWASQVTALRAYNKLLVDASEEEHR